MQFEEMLSWLLYYVSLFDVSKAPPAQIADPLGLVQTQAIESAAGGLRITLNGSASPQTLSARFLQGFHGSGVQHIALATADILAAARRLRELGLATLPIPQNYYEDLDARFGLDPSYSRNWHNSTYSTTAIATESTFNSSRELLRNASFSRLSSGAATAASVRSTRRFAWRRSPAIAMTSKSLPDRCSIL